EEALQAPMRGSFPPALVGTDWSGDQEEIGYGRDSRATLVFTFTKECPECRESWQALRSAQSLAPSSLRIVYVDVIDKLVPVYLASNRIPRNNLLVSLSPLSAVAYGARTVPQSELLDRGGKVVWTH